MINLQSEAQGVEPELREIDQVLQNLSRSDESRIEWAEYDSNTARLESAQAIELVYSRSKLRYLYANGSDDTLRTLVRAGSRFDAMRATYDLIKLLNTNFDSYNIHWALGTLFKDLWQLETATLWFEQMLLYPALPPAAQAKAYVELADCFAWQNRNLPKAVEFAKLALDLGDAKDSTAISVLAHAFLRQGQVRLAKACLEQTEMD